MTLSIGSSLERGRLTAHSSLPGRPSISPGLWVSVAPQRRQHHSGAVHAYAEQRHRQRIVGGAYFVVPLVTGATMEHVTKRGRRVNNEKPHPRQAPLR